MFLAKFQQVSSDKFNADKNNNFPFIGTIIAGQAKATIINGTMFLREGLVPNKIYICENKYSEEYSNYSTEVLSEVSLLELQPLRTQLGEPKLTLDVEVPA